jgi:hypothetical protein
MPHASPKAGESVGHPAHDERKCDLIVCWEHNWPEAPMEVIELRKFIG